MVINIHDKWYNDFSHGEFCVVYGSQWHAIFYLTSII